MHFPIHTFVSVPALAFLANKPLLQWYICREQSYPIPAFIYRARRTMICVFSLVFSSLSYPFWCPSLPVFQIKFIILYNVPDKVSLRSYMAEIFLYLYWNQIPWRQLGLIFVFGTATSCQQFIRSVILKSIFWVPLLSCQTEVLAYLFPSTKLHICT